ncbi:MAG: DUF924 family protein [Pseudomonadota bacterium]
MAGDLGMSASEVHAAARAVLRFWLEETPAKLHYAKNDGLDAAIAERFGVLRDTVLRTKAAGWTDEPDTLLAAIILLDQFSRNLFRGQAEAFAGDALARSLTKAAVRSGWDGGMTGNERAFLYMPLMHSEDSADQAASVTAFAASASDNLKYARDHAAVIERFGRFPSRNAALGRTSTPAEVEYLSQPGAGW